MKLSLLLIAACVLVLNQASAFTLKSAWPITHSYWKENIIKTLNETECVYFISEKIFSCGSPVAPVVSCNAVYNFTGLDVDYFGSFALGLDSTADLRVDAGGLYNLYPSIHGKRCWFMSNHVSLNGAMAHFHLYWNTSYNHFGVAINDKACFSNLIDLFVKGKDLVRDYELKSFSLVKPHFKYIGQVYFVY